jgi:hypothetical protein
MKRKLPQLSSSLKLGEVFGKLLGKVPLKGMPLDGKPLKDRRLLLLVVLVGAGLFLLRGALVGSTEPEAPVPPPPPQQTVTEPPTIAVPPPQPSSFTSPPQVTLPPTPQAPENQMPGAQQREESERVPPPQKERPETAKIPRDPFLYPPKADERSPRVSPSSPGSLSPSSLPPPPLPNPSPLERLPTPPPSLPSPPPPSGQNDFSRPPLSPPQPKVIGVAFGVRAMAVLSLPGEGEVPLFVGETYKGWKVTGIERKPDVVLVRVKTPDGREVILKHY